MKYYSTQNNILVLPGDYENGERTRFPISYTTIGTKEELRSFPKFAYLQKIQLTNEYLKEQQKFYCLKGIFNALHIPSVQKREIEEVFNLIYKQFSSKYKTMKKQLLIAIITAKTDYSIQEILDITSVRHVSAKSIRQIIKNHSLNRLKSPYDIILDKLDTLPIDNKLEFLDKFNQIYEGVFHSRFFPRTSAAAISRLILPNIIPTKNIQEIFEIKKYSTISNAIRYYKKIINQAEVCG